MLDISRHPRRRIKRGKFHGLVEGKVGSKKGKRKDIVKPTKTPQTHVDTALTTVNGVTAADRSKIAVTPYRFRYVGFSVLLLQRGDACTQEVMDVLRTLQSARTIKACTGDLFISYEEPTRYSLPSWAGSLRACNICTIGYGSLETTPDSLCRFVGTASALLLSSPLRLLSSTAMRCCPLTPVTPAVTAAIFRGIQVDRPACFGYRNLLSGMVERGTSSWNSRGKR